MYLEINTSKYVYNLNHESSWGGGGDEKNLLKTKVKIIYLFLKGSDWTMSLDGHDKFISFHFISFHLEFNYTFSHKQ